MSNATSKRYKKQPTRFDSSAKPSGFKCPRLKPAFLDLLPRAWPANAASLTLAEIAKLWRIRPSELAFFLTAYNENNEEKLTCSDFTAPTALPTTSAS